MAWDGYFHLAVWIMTLIGLGMLWGAGSRKDVAWSGKTFLGSLILGWGLFNLIEGIINHQLPGIHNVYEYTDNKLSWNLGFSGNRRNFFISDRVAARQSRRQRSRGTLKRVLKYKVKEKFL